MAKKRFSLIRWIGGLALAGVVALCAALALFAYWLPRSGVARDLQAALSQSLGRDVGLSGGVSLKLFPLFGVEAKGFSIANIPGGQAAHLMEADAIDVGIEPLSLLTAHIQIHQISLAQPQLHLEKLADGRINWVLGTKAPKTPFTPPKWLKDLSIDDLSVRSGQIAFADFKTNGKQAINEINVSIRLAGLDQPGAATGSFSLAGQPAKVTLKLDNPREAINGRSSGVHLALDSQPITLQMDGAGAVGSGPITGQVEVSGPSLRDLAKLAGKPLAPSPGLGAFSVRGRLEKDGQTVRLSAAKFALDHLTASGDLLVDMSGPRPNVLGAIAIPVLDMNPYLGPDAAPQPNAGWPTTPISLAGLRAFDADLTITAGQVKFHKILLSNTMLRARINDGAADIALGRMSLYGGVGSGRLIASDVAGGGRYGGQFQLNGVDARRLLGDLAGIDRIVGSASGSVNLAAQGGSVNAIMHSLSGRASMTVANGAVTGVDLAAISKNVAAALSGGAVGPNARTPFSVAGASFGLAHGVAATNNLTLSGPGIAVSGVGSIDLGGRAIDMVIKPQGGANIAGHRLDLGAIPFRVHGPWTKLSFEPDLSGVAQRLLGQQVNALIGSQGGGLGGLLQGLPGGDAQAQPGSASQKPKPATKPNSVMDLLNGLTGR